MTGGGWAKCNLHKLTAKPVRQTPLRLHQSLWCELVELPNSAFSGVRAAVIDSLEKQAGAPGAFDQDALVKPSVGSLGAQVCVGAPIFVCCTVNFYPQK